MQNAGVVVRADHRYRRLLVVIAVIVTGCLGMGAALAPAQASARTKKVRESISLRLVKKSGSSFRHRGKATGTVDGSVRSRMKLSSLSLKGVVTIVTKHGSLRIKVRGTARSGGLRARFDGTATMAGGTGRYRRAHGRGRFSGVVNRRTWATTIRATGSLAY